MKKTLSLILALMMLLCCFAAAEEAADAPAETKQIEALTVFQSFDGEDAASALQFINPDVESIAALVDGAVQISNEFWTEWTQLHVNAQADGTLADADGLIFSVQRLNVTKEGSNMNFTCQISDGNVEFEYNASTLYYKADGSEEWVELPFYGGWGANFPADTNGLVYLPFSGFTKQTSGEGPIDLTQVIWVQFWLNTYGAQHGSVVLDSFGGAVEK